MIVFEKPRPVVVPVNVRDVPKAVWVSPEYVATPAIADCTTGAPVKVPVEVKLIVPE